MRILDRRPRVTLWLLRTVVTVHLVAVLSQPVWAGLFLTGDVDAMAVHGAVGDALAALGLLTIAAALGHALRGRGALWVVPLAVVWFLALGLQIGAGHSRALALHVPLGVGLVVVAVLATVWVWSPAAGRVR